MKLRKIDFRGLKGQFDVINDNFIGLIAKYVYLWPILAYRTNLWPIFLDYNIHPRKLGFMGLKGQFDVKKSNFRGLTAKIGYLRPILTFRDHLWPIFLGYAIGIVA